MCSRTRVFANRSFCSFGVEEPAGHLVREHVLFANVRSFAFVISNLTNKSVRATTVQGTRRRAAVIVSVLSTDPPRSNARPAPPSVVGRG